MLETARSVGTTNGSRAVLAFQTTRSLERYLDVLRDTLSYPKESDEENTPSRSTHEFHTNATYLAVHRLIIGDIRDVVAQIRQKSDRLALECRAHPGRSSYLYLLFLQDHLRYALRYAQQASKDLQALKPAEAETALRKLHASVQNDLTWLLSAITEAILLQDAVLSQAKILQELKGGQTAQVMNVLVAIYVPLVCLIRCLEWSDITEPTILRHSAPVTSA